MSKYAADSHMPVDAAELVCWWHAQICEMKIRAVKDEASLGDLVQILPVVI